MSLNYCNLEYNLFLKIKKFIHRIKWIIQEKLLYGLFEHFILIPYTPYGRWQMIEDPNSRKMNASESKDSNSFTLSE